jgi:hypothetical protein
VEVDRAREPAPEAADSSPVAVERGRDLDLDHSDRKVSLAEFRVSPPCSHSALFC